MSWGYEIELCLGVFYLKINFVYGHRDMFNGVDQYNIVLSCLVITITPQLVYTECNQTDYNCVLG